MPPAPLLQCSQKHERTAVGSEATVMRMPPQRQLPEYGATIMPGLGMPLDFEITEDTNCCRSSQSAFLTYLPVSMSPGSDWQSCHQSGDSLKFQWTNRVPAIQAGENAKDPLPVPNHTHRFISFRGSMSSLSFPAAFLIEHPDSCRLTPIPAYDHGALRIKLSTQESKLMSSVKSQPRLNKQANQP